MKNLIIILISILFIVSTTSYKTPEKQKFIQIEYTGISETYGRWLFITTKPVDTATIENSLKDLKIKADSLTAIYNHMSSIQEKIFTWHGLFKVVVTDERTFSEGARFIDKYESLYDNSRHSDFMVIVNGTRHPVDLKRQKKFFDRLAKYLADKNCDTVVVKSLHRFMLQHYLSDAIH